MRLRVVVRLLLVAAIVGSAAGCAKLKRKRAAKNIEQSEVIMPPLSMSTEGVIDDLDDIINDLPSGSSEEIGEVDPELLVAPEAVDVDAEAETEVLLATPTPVYAYKLQPGDPVIIHLRGIYPKDDEVEDIVDDEGNLTLPHLGDILAAGKSTSQLEAEIRSRYINEKIYTTITVNVVMPQKTYFIQGEVRNPGRFPIVGGMTIMQAIAAAGGYTEFASPRNVVLNRAGTKTEVNMRRIQKNPDEDIRLESGDVIVVERSIF